MAHAQKPDFVFRRNGRVHFNWRVRQFSRLLAAEMCASAVVMLATPRSEVVREYWLPTPLASFPFTSPPVRHRVPSGFKHTLPDNVMFCHRTFTVSLMTTPYLCSILWLATPCPVHVTYSRSSLHTFSAFSPPPPNHSSAFFAWLFTFTISLVWEIS